MADPLLFLITPELGFFSHRCFPAIAAFVLSQKSGRDTLKAKMKDIITQALNMAISIRWRLLLSISVSIQPSAISTFGKP
ncbi:hypothetical protein M1N20_03975 [Dehalococcoidia bacterium]|nr:hypothetical protein [Dehalococcoidia bacterium]